MKLLVTAYDFRPDFGGIATVGHELASAMVRKGVEVHVLASARPETEAADEQLPYQVHRYPFSQNSWKASLQFTTQTKKLVQELNPDAVLHLLWFPEALASLRPLGCPSFLLVHGSEVMESKRTFRKRLRAKLRPLKKLLFQSMTEVFTISHFSQKLIQKECGLSAEKTQIVFNGVNTDEFFPEPVSGQFRESYGAKGRRVLLTLSRLENYKGIDMVLRAIPKIRLTHPEVLLFVVGQGPDEKRLKKMTSELRISDHVRFLGPVAFEERRRLFNLSEMVILMTRTDLVKPDCEGFGLVILEAGACGTPAVAANEGGIPDAVEDGVSGILTDPRSPEKIAKSVIKLLSDESLRKELGQNALTRAKTFSWEAMAQRMISRIERHVRN